VIRRDERGAVTAELALGLPILIALTVGLTWLLAVGMAQVRTVDAARETARAVARGDTEEAAVAAGRSVAPPGSRIVVSRSGGHVVVRVRGELAGPGGVFARFPGAALEAEAVALDEVP
jgi:Flp pilus assembly protein TadG